MSASAELFIKKQQRPEDSVLRLFYVCNFGQQNFDNQVTIDLSAVNIPSHHLLLQSHNLMIRYKLGFTYNKKYSLHAINENLNLA
jgi:hypothetical protein